MTAATLTLAAVALFSGWRAVVAARARVAVGARAGFLAPSSRLPSGRVGARVGRRFGWGARGDADPLPDVIDAVAGALRSGVPPVDAFRAAARGAPPGVARELAGVATAVERGMSLRAAVDRWAMAADADGPRLVAAAVAVHADAGGDPGPALTGVADTLRERRALRREIRALSSQARMSAAVIGGAPLAFAVVAAGTDRATAAFLVTTPLGLGCLLVGLGLELVGWRWMDRITRSVT